MAKTVQIPNVPEDVHARRKARAARATRMSLSNFLLKELEAVAERPTPEEMLARLESREPVSLSESPEEAVRALRDGG